MNILGLKQGITEPNRTTETSSTLLELIITNSLYDSTDVDLAVQYFTSSLQLVFETQAPHIEKRVKGGPCPWQDTDTKKLMNRRNQTVSKLIN